MCVCVCVCTLALSVPMVSELKIAFCVQSTSEEVSYSGAAGFDICWRAQSSDEDVSDVLENPEEMFPSYCVYDVYTRFKSSSTPHRIVY